jgi:hypothetical protein
LLPAGKPPAEALAIALEDREELPHFAEDLRARAAPARGCETELEVLVHREVRIDPTALGNERDTGLSDLLGSAPPDGAA